LRCGPGVPLFYGLCLSSLIRTETQWGCREDFEAMPNLLTESNGKAKGPSKRSIFIVVKVKFMPNEIWRGFSAEH